MKYIIAIAAFIAACWLFSVYEGRHATVQSQVAANNRDYYLQVFNYTMDNIPADGHFDWQTYNAKGSIAATATFVSKSGYTCRGFTETYSVLGSKPGSEKGYACRRAGGNGWCRLKTSDALTCAMENPSYQFSLPGMAAPGMPDAEVSAPDINTGGIHTGVNSNIDVASPDAGGRKASAGNAADTITGAAGSAAGYIARNAASWFQSLFR